jgi:hypothetical protein
VEEVGDVTENTKEQRKRKRKNEKAFKLKTLCLE